MATSEIEVAHGLPRYIYNFTDALQKVIHDVGKRIIGSGIKTQPAQMCSHRVIQRVNREEEEAEVQKRKKRIGMINFLGLSHKRENQSDLRRAWFMFQNIYFHI